MRGLPALLVLLAGCGGAPLETPADLARSLDGGVMTLGGSDVVDGGFVPLTAGQDAALIEGAQGGFHVWMKFRLRGIPPGHYHVGRIAHRARDGKIVLRIPADAIDVGSPNAEGFWELPSAVPMFMCPSPIGISVVDEPIDYEIDLLGDDGGTITSGTVTLVPRCPAAPADKKAFCLRICTG